MDSFSATMAVRAAFSSSSSPFFSVSPIPDSNPKPPCLFKLQYPKFRIFKCRQSFKNASPLYSSSPPPSLCRSVATFSPSQTAEHVPQKFRRLAAEFSSLKEPIERVKRLLHCASLLPRLAESARVDSNRVMGCTTQVWLEASLGGDGRVRFAADSDSEITRGFCYCLVSALDGASAEEVLEVKTDDLGDINVGIPAVRGLESILGTMF